MCNRGTEEPSTLHHKQAISGEEMHTLITFMLNVMASNIYVTEFAKRGLIHASNVSTLRMCNSTSIRPTALKFGSRTLLSLY